MIYLSSAYLNRGSEQVRRDVADCREMHRTVMRAFPQAPEGASPGDAFGVLYRLDRDAPDRIRLLLQSSERPQWSEVAKVDGYLDPRAPGENPDVKEVESLYSALRVGQILRFRLRANPTKRVGNSGETGSVGKRVDLRREHEQLAWLIRKAEASGFAVESTRTATGVPDIRIVAEDRAIGKRQSHGKPMTFGSVLFEGHLRITDADVFQQTLANGIGSGKAYGFGLLSIAPA